MHLEGRVLYGEVYGWVADLRYGHRPGHVSFVAFDIFDPATGRFHDYDEFTRAVEALGIPLAPVLYRGPWDPLRIAEWTEGPSRLFPGHIREGAVVRPVRERFDERVGRVILKQHGEGYLLGER